jgi:hypothetical protein
MIKSMKFEMVSVSMIALDGATERAPRFEVAVIRGGQIIYRLRSYVRMAADVDFATVCRWFKVA